MPGVEQATSPARPADRTSHQPSDRHGPGSDLVCSARSCGGHATWALRWNNPRLHTPERRKVWLACDEHLEHLTEFLTVRGFLRETVAVTDVLHAQPV